MKMISKNVTKSGDSNIVRVTGYYNVGDNVVVLSQEEFRNLLRGS